MAESSAIKKRTLMKAGDKYGRLTSIKRVEGKRPKWLFSCECGGETVTFASCVKSGNTKSCGCLSRENRKYPILEKDERVGRLVVVGQISGGWLFKCDCGSDFISTSSPVRMGMTVSCGCFAREKAVLLGRSKRKHNGKGTPEYECWKHMKRRCTKPNDSR